VDRAKAWELQHVSLPVACRVIYSRLTGMSATAQPAGETILNDVAHAVSHLVQIHSLDLHSAAPRALDSAEMLGGAFQRGAREFRKRSGEQLYDLSMQRGDMIAAIEILRSAHIRFHQS
jgi:hypothetical protein